MNSQKTILVVEDNAINRMTLCGILSPQYRVLEAENGQQALSILGKHTNEISLILLDIVMPVMDGYTFLSAMKAELSFSSIPVIVTTQSDSESDEVTALSHGATDFVTKPYKAQVILHRVAGIINLRETAAMINQIQYDQLTGLYSKEFFYQQVKVFLGRNPDKAYDLVCSDVENFKLVNDVFGVKAGDRLLRAVADGYRHFVGDPGLCGRLHADQFICLTEHHPDYTDEMFLRAGKLINGLYGSGEIVLKWGIYEIQDRGVPVEHMCDRALLAAQSVKGQYGKHFALYDSHLRDKLLREQAITESMESALAEGQFVLYLQPKYRIQDYRLVGAEALVRWEHPEWGLQPPGEFIPLFERNGFITKLDQFVWEKACAILRDWDARGFPPIPVSVNVSRADIYQADIVDILTGILKKYGLPPSRLHLEITESAYTEHPEQIIQTVGRLHQLGFIIEMDDFGSGYSSLNMLNEMPMDVLKLDMKFIQSDVENASSQGILLFIVGLARYMKLSVTAEGVETHEQLEHLRELGCDQAQGYYLAKPMALKEFEDLLREQQETGAGQEAVLSQACRVDRREQVILLADEDESYRAEVRKAFGTRFRIVEAASVEAAMLCITSYNTRIAAVLLSMTLPGPDAFPVLEMLRDGKSVWNIPVVAMGNWEDALERKALDRGADDFADKAHSPESLFRRTLHVMRAAAAVKREQLLQQKANQDWLTGLLNRWGLSSTFDSLQKDDLPLAVYLFDLDNLKQINDTYGHEAGDRLIKQFGVLLRTQTRATDILARYGGDEFIVVMRNMKSEEYALQKGVNICRAMLKAGQSRGYSAACTAGVAFCPSLEPLADLIAKADQALYLAKRSGKGGCQLWRGETDE